MFRIVEATLDSSLTAQRYDLTRDSFGEGDYITNNRSGGLCSSDCHCHRLGPLDFAFIVYKSRDVVRIEVGNVVLENTLIDVLGPSKQHSQLGWVIWNSADLLARYNDLEKRLQDVIQAQVGSIGAEPFLPLRLLVDGFLAQEYGMISETPRHLGPSHVLWDVLLENDDRSMREPNLFKPAREDDIKDLLSTRTALARLSYQISEDLSDSQVNKQLPHGILNLNVNDVHGIHEGEAALHEATGAKDNPDAISTHNYESGARALSCELATNDVGKMGSNPARPRPGNNDDYTKLLPKPNRQPRINNPREAKAAVRSFFIRQYWKVRRNKIFEQVRGRFSNSEQAWRFGMEALEKIIHGYAPKELGIVIAILCVCKAVAAALHAHDTSHSLSYDSVFERDLPRWFPLFHGDERSFFENAALEIWNLQWYMWETPSNLDYHDLFQRAEHLTANLITVAEHLLNLPAFIKQGKSGEIQQTLPWKKQPPPKDPDPGGPDLAPEIIAMGQFDSWRNLRCGAIVSLISRTRVKLFSSSVDNIDNDDSHNCTTRCYFNYPIYSLFDRPADSILISLLGQTAIEHSPAANPRDSSTCSLSTNPAVGSSNSPINSTISTATSDLSTNTTDNLAATANDRYAECITEPARTTLEESIQKPERKGTPQSPGIRGNPLQIPEGMGRHGNFPHCPGLGTLQKRRVG
ncbi:hypothetical protein N0V84_004132 [Fusarium piperis]|uniref:Uncharacterized protein n=1 Tax=Fusarium piperis TaxID=1435070 RepID=A0A9W8WG97_9HYPO|nr:hypothetical protein N0V84_004132 [Fusarium piperis]